MPLTDSQIRSYITKLIIMRLNRTDTERTEALKDFLAISMPTAGPEASEKIATMIPSVLPNLYAKWIDMFVTSLLEKLPHDVLEGLCAGDEENDAALLLSYIMFLESERMEKQIDTDLREYGKEHSGDEDMGNVAAEYIRARMTQLAQETNSTAVPPTERIQ